MRQLAVQYVGDEGVTRQCIDALCRHLQYGDPVSESRVLSARGGHAVTLRTKYDEVIAIRSGFASGYEGEGPRGLSTAICILQSFGLDPTEIKVTPAFLKRLNGGRLTNDDLRTILAAPPLVGGGVDHYVNHSHAFEDRGTLVANSFQPVVPFGVLDSRLVDLAVSFWDEPDDRLMKGYRRLEDAIRARTGLSLHGAKLFSRVFGSKGSVLRWSGVEPDEADARAQFFVSAYRSFRNARAHRELPDQPREQLAEFMTLNHLFRLERQAEGVHSATEMAPEQA